MTSPASYKMLGGIKKLIQVRIPKGIIMFYLLKTVLVLNHNYVSTSLPYPLGYKHSYVTSAKHIQIFVK